MILKITLYLWAHFSIWFLKIFLTLRRFQEYFVQDMWSVPLPLSAGDTQMRSPRSVTTRIAFTKFSLQRNQREQTEKKRPFCGHKTSPNTHLRTRRTLTTIRTWYGLTQLRIKTRWCVLGIFWDWYAHVRHRTSSENRQNISESFSYEGISNPSEETVVSIRRHRITCTAYQIPTQKGEWRSFWWRRICSSYQKWHQNQF